MPSSPVVIQLALEIIVCDVRTLVPQSRLHVCGLRKVLLVGAVRDVGVPVGSLHTEGKHHVVVLVDEVVAEATTTTL